jgi:hypothetical protein
LISVALALGIVGVVIGNWFTVAGMALLVLSQTLNDRASRRELRDRDSG